MAPDVEDKEDVNDLAHAERMLHLVTDLEILEIQAGALKEILRSRMAAAEAVTADEYEKMNAFINRLAARLRSKAQNIYAALHQ